MKVQLPEDRKDNSCVLCGVEFVSGVGELNKSEVEANVFENLLARYYGVEKFKAKAAPKKVEAKKAAK